MIDQTEDQYKGIEPPVITSNRIKLQSSHTSTNEHNVYGEVICEVFELISPLLGLWIDLNFLFSSSFLVGDTICLMKNL